MEGQMHGRAGLPRPGVLGHEGHEPLSPADPVQGLGLRLQCRWPGAQLQAVVLWLKADSHRRLRRMQHHPGVYGAPTFHLIDARGQPRQCHHAP
jgi:hypothetical protein